MPETTTGTTTERPRFEIKDQASAEWYARRLRQLDEDAAAVAAATAQRLDEIQRDRARLVAAYQSQFDTWARAEAERRRRRTLTLPLAGAVVTIRTTPGAVVCTESAAEIATTLGFVKPAAADLAAYRAHAAEHLRQTGELLPGVAWREPGESIKIKPATTAPEEGDATE